MRAKGKGFTLVELLIVIVIIGILATMAIPQYNKMVEKSRGSEAYNFLSHIRKSELTYYMEQNHYAVLGIPQTANSDWEGLLMDNPNANPNGYFAYGVSLGEPPFTIQIVPAPPTGSTIWYAIAARRNTRSAYSVDLLEQGIIMNLDTGKVYKSDQY